MPSDFQRLSGDVNVESPRVNITVNSNVSITANWRVQYLVTYYGPHPHSTAKREEWHDKGEVFKINVTKIVDKDITSDYVFDHWKVNGNPVGSPLELKIEIDSRGD